jgi:CRP-like cAMP-binding protein
VLLLIKEQFARKELKTCDVDYEMLSRMLSKNTYFSHFKNNTRQLLLLISQHKLIRQGEIFFHSDQLENTILVVISGAVSIYMCNSDKKNLRTFRNTLYPGESIGDAPLRLIIPSDKVGHLYFELKAAVDSDILLIKKDDVPSIL